LQKAAYLAADIFDHLGVRLVFATRFECLLALRALQRSHLLSVTNVDAGRTRNTLLDLDAAKIIFNKYRSRIAASEGYPSELLRQMDAELPNRRSHSPAATTPIPALATTACKSPCAR
jgi:uncharacterized protein (TIGR04562 family)